MKSKHGGNADNQGEANFKGVLEEYDRQMGRLFEGLKKLGVAENTLVLFTGDNGPLPSYSNRRTGGLRGSKLSLYEGGIREPFLVWWPGHTPAGRVNDATAFTAVDLLPSLCRIAGVSIPKEVAAKLDGEDLSSALTGNAPRRHKVLFWEYGRNSESFVYPKAPRDRSPNIAVRDGQWKLLTNADGSGAELFDMASDPKEEKNLVNKKPEVAKRLSKLALTWRKSLP